MKFILILASALLFVSAGMSYACFWSSAKDEKLVNKITAKTAQKLKKEKGLILIGTGGRMMDDIKMLSMSFNYYQVVDIDEARRLLVYCAEEYLSAINENEKVRPYLHNYPFTAKNIEIKIFVCNPDGSDVTLNNLSIAGAREEKVDYKTYCHETYSLTTIREETYEEAFKIVSSQKPTSHQEPTKTVDRKKNKKRNETITMVETTAKDGAKVNIGAESLSYATFFLTGEGFKPYESMNLISNSGQKIIHTQIQANKKGKLPTIGLQPTVTGKSGGICHIDLLREKDSIHIKYPWGSEAEKNNDIPSSVES